MTSAKVRAQHREATKRYRARHPERYREQTKKYNARSLAKPGARAAAAERSKIWRQEDPVRAKASSVRYREKHRARANAQRRRWRKAHPAVDRAIDARRRARKKNAMCVCCTAQQFIAFYGAAMMVGHHVDHIVPLADGGMHCLKNLQLLSPEDHKRKTAEENRRRRR